MRSQGQFFVVWFFCFIGYRRGAAASVFNMRTCDLLAEAQTDGDDSIERANHRSLVFDETEIVHDGYAFRFPGLVKTLRGIRPGIRHPTDPTPQRDRTL